MNINTVNDCPFCGSDNLQFSDSVLMPFVASRALGYSPFKIDKSWGLRDLPADIEVFMPCKTVACKSCGGMFLDIRFNDSQMQSLYQDYRTTSYNEMRSKYEPHYSSQYQDLDIPESYIREKESFILNNCELRDSFSLLDWGANTSQTTPFRTSPNAKVSAYDISGCAEFSKLEELPHGFSVISCSHVLEHVPYPVNELKTIRDYIEPLGYLYIELPYEKIMASSTPLIDKLNSKRHWHEHINFFSEKAIQSMLSEAGFSVICCEIKEPAAPGNFEKVFFVIAQKN